MTSATASTGVASGAQLRIFVPLTGNTAFDQTLDSLASRYQRAHKDAKIELSRKGPPFQTLRAVIASHFAGDLPDLAIVQDSDVTTLAELGVVAPIENSVLRSLRLQPELFHRPLAHTENSPCAIPLVRDFAVWFFNRELLFRFHQNTDQIPTSWTALSAYSFRIRKPDEIWAMAIAASGPQSFFRWPTLGLSTLAPDPVAATVDWVRRLWEHPASWTPTLLGLEDSTRYFIDQRASLLAGSFSQAPSLKKTVSFRMGVALPDGPVSLFGYDLVALKTDSGKISKEALEFLRFLYEATTQNTLLLASPGVPVIAPAALGKDFAGLQSSWPQIAAANLRKKVQLELALISPPLREEWAATAWKAILQRPSSPEEAAKTLEQTRAAFQKLLSTKSR